MLKKIIAISALALTTITAQASGGLFVEPLVSYESLDTRINWPSSVLSDSTGTLKGLGLGGRIGGHFADSFLFGFDARYSKATFKDSSTNADAESTGLSYGPFVGLQTPFAGLRLIGQYVMDGTIDPAKTSFIDYKFDKGNGFRIGAGIHIAMISVNLEYQDLKYRTNVQEFFSIPSSTSFDNTELSSKGYVLSVGLPIEL